MMKRHRILKYIKNNSRKFFLCLCFCLFHMMLCAQQDVIKKIEGNNEGWTIETKSSVYQILITKDNKVYPVYYGSKPFSDNPDHWIRRVEELPARGGYATKTPVLEVIYSDYARETDLLFVSAEKIIIDNRPVLKIVQKDKTYPLQVISYIRALYEFDVLEKWIEVKNTGKSGNIKVENLLSGNILLPTDRYVLTQLSGSELREFQEYKAELTPGVKVIENKTFKSNSNMPWFMVRPEGSANADTGPTWWGQIGYSGNWKLIFDNTYSAYYNYTLQVAAGINFWDTDWILKPGGEFITPKFSVGYTTEGAEGAARSNAAYVRETILPASHREELRPVLFNSWYATTYNINEKDQIAMAKIASKMGVELFAIDDGWFRGRVKSDQGLGDWEVDKVKFPSGLGSMIDSIHNMGMKFGIWVEPESAVLKSDVYRNHPDWILQYPKTVSKPYRVFLNLAKQEVYDYLYNSLDKLLTDNKIDFVKWDQNSTLSSTGWPDAPVEMQKEVRIKFISNVYKLVDALRKRHPNVLFESCASGGGRVDLGMLSRMDQAWISDNSTAVDRLFIQYGYLGVLPANTMVSWVIESIANQRQINAPLSYKFDVAMSGVLGIGYDIRKFTPAEIELAKSKIEIYKNIRPLVQQGNLHRLVSPFENNHTALQYNNSVGDKSVLFCYNLAIYLSSPGYVKNTPLQGAQLIDRGSTKLKLKGLLPERSYRIQDTNNKNDKGIIYTGSFLMDVGLAWPVQNSFESKILTITAI